MLEPINHLEKALISKLRSHPVFQQLPDLSWSDFLAILIQRRFLSLNIVNVYELAIDAVTDSGVKQTVREILHEEYPRSSKGRPLPSHREHLFQDLINLGASPQTILTTSATEQTSFTSNQSYRIMTDCLSDEYAQIKLVAFLRFWAEVLVAVEYACFWQRLSEKLADKASGNKPRSEFYYFHLIHDRRNSDFGTANLLGGLTHAEQLAAHLKRLITRSEEVDACLEITETAYYLKRDFYNQFVTHPIGLTRQKKPCKGEVKPLQG